MIKLQKFDYLVGLIKSLLDKAFEVVARTGIEPVIPKDFGSIEPDLLKQKSHQIKSDGIV